MRITVIQSHLTLNVLLLRAFGCQYSSWLRAAIAAFPLFYVPYWKTCIERSSMVRCGLLRRQAIVRKWAAEVASRARFASALPLEEAAANPGSLPVPCLVVNNKADLRGAQSTPPSK